MKSPSGSVCVVRWCVSSPFVILFWGGGFLGLLLRCVLVGEDGEGWGMERKTRTHDVKIDGMIDKIILARFDAFGGTEIDAVGSTHVFDLLPGARQADEGGVEFREVFFEDGGGVAGGVAGYE